VKHSAEAEGLAHHALHQKLNSRLLPLGQLFGAGELGDAAAEDGIRTRHLFMYLRLVHVRPLQKDPGTESLQAYIGSIGAHVKRWPRQGVPGKMGRREK
jgi:hypothetical protein